MTTLNVRMRTDATPDKLLIELAKSPLVYIRLAGMLFSIIVFGCMSDKGSGTEGYCVLNRSNACSFGIAIGVLAFLICLSFLVKDVMMVVIDFSETIVFKKVLIVVDIGVNGLWTFLWFVAFCFITDQYRVTVATGNFTDASTRTCMGSTVAFSLFSFLLWISIIVWNVILLLRIIRGSDSSVRASGYGDVTEQDDDDQEDYDNSPTEQKKQYTPPEY